MLLAETFCFDLERNSLSPDGYTDTIMCMHHFSATWSTLASMWWLPVHFKYFGIVVLVFNLLYLKRTTEDP